MKRILAVGIIAILVSALFAACGDKSGEDSDMITIKVGATPVPHAEILEEAAKLMEKEGYNLEIVEFSDYVQPNTALESGDIDANYFQHQTYLDEFNVQKGTHLVTAANVHYEPFGIYAGKSDDLKKVPQAAKIAVPNDTTNEARALLLLEQEGLIKLKEGVGILATKRDIVENPKKLEIIELEAAAIPRAIEDVDFAVINGNYALASGLSMKDALAVEAADSVATTAYVNVLCVKEGNENKEAVKALAKVLGSKEIKDFINKKYKGAVVPVEVK